MSHRNVLIQPVILLVLLSLFVSGCRSSRNRDTSPTQTVEAAQAVLDVVTATPTSAATTNSSAEETPEFPPTSTPVAIAIDATTGDKVSDSSGTTSLASKDTASSVAASGQATSNDVAQPANVVEEPRNGIIPQHIQIPSIALDTPVVELSWHAAQSDDGQIFSEWDVADQAAGWHKNSSMLGERGNVVLSGHNNILGAVFRELDQLKRGDEAILSTEEGTHRYLVDKVMIVPEKYTTQEQREANAAWIGHFEDDRLTLVSCWPRDDNSHRIIVVAYADESATQ